MQAGILRETFTVQHPTVVSYGYCDNTTTWTDLLTTRASVGYNNGNRVNENNEITFAYEVSFTMRVYHQINERMRIIWQGKKYRILSIELDKHKQKQTIRTELINE